MILVIYGNLNEHIATDKIYVNVFRSTGVELLVFLLYTLPYTVSLLVSNTNARNVICHRTSETIVNSLDIEVLFKMLLYPLAAILISFESSAVFAATDDRLFG